MEELMRKRTVTIPSSLNAIEATTNIGRVSARLCGFDESANQWIELALREAIVNAIRHGNKEDCRKLVHLQFVCSDDAFTMTIEDQGSGFDPTAVANPLDAEHLLNPSGRGIFLMRSLMDEVQFAGSPTGGTLVCMTKRKGPKPS
jgi:serine/threonine-protein kinase RsbW